MDTIHAKRQYPLKTATAARRTGLKSSDLAALLRQVAARRELGLVGRLKPIVIIAIMFDVYNSIVRRRM